MVGGGGSGLARCHGLGVTMVDGYVIVFFSSGRRHTIFDCDWSSDVCSSDLRLRSSVETPFWRKSASTPSRCASHSIVSRVGRVLPRSIWLTYSLLNRSPARWVWVDRKSVV